MGDELLDSNDPGSEEYKSKTQIKKQLLELVTLAETLVDMGSANIAKLPLDSDILDAVQQAKNMHRKKPSYRRQLQFIGKLFRSRDVEPLLQALQNIQGKQTQANAHFHLLEKLRDKLVAGDDQVLQNLINDYPNLDRQRLRQWMRQAKKELQQEKPPKAAREIFQYLKQEIQQ